MFAGIVDSVGKIVFFDKKKKIIGIKSNYKNLKLGESICCNGICLTVSKKKDSIFFCNLSRETIDRTNLSKKKINQLINLERSLKVGDEISGHLVFGHIDGISEVKKISNYEDSTKIILKSEAKIMKYLIEKCSICLDGISLTVNKADKNSFNISIIPYTWNNTNLKYIKVGSILNTEIDMISRYVFKALKK